MSEKGSAIFINLLNVAIHTFGSSASSVDGRRITYPSRGAEYGLDWDENSNLSFEYDVNSTHKTILEDNVYIDEIISKCSDVLPPQKPNTFYIVPVSIAMLIDRPDFVFPCTKLSTKAGDKYVIYKTLARFKHE